MIILAVFGFCWIAIFIVAVAVIAAAVSNAADDPMFAATPEEEFADDYQMRRCARPHCTDPVFRDSLCADHFDVMVGMVDELRRDLEEA